MNFQKIVLFSLLQGVTQIFPVSSSGHRELVQHFVVNKDAVISIDLLAHIGACAATLLYFRRDFVAMVSETFRFFSDWARGERSSLFEKYPQAAAIIYVFIASVPTAILAIVFSDILLHLGGFMIVLGAAWISNAIALLTGRFFSLNKRARQLNSMSHFDAFFVGVGQAAALVPGVSRTGASFLAARFSRFEPRDSLRFALLLGIPWTAGVFIYKAAEFRRIFSMAPMSLLTGFFVSFAASSLAIIFLFKIVNRGKIHFFGYYCLLLGLLSLYWAWS